VTDSVILRVPTGPQYSYFELKLEFETFDQLDSKINELHNGLLAKLSAAVSTACEMAKLEPSAFAQMNDWEARQGPSGGTPDPVATEDKQHAAAVDTVKQELGATMLAQYKTAPWEEPPAVESRPAPPWAAPPTPVATVSGALNLDDF